MMSTLQNNKACSKTETECCAFVTGWKSKYDAVVETTVANANILNTNKCWRVLSVLCFVLVCAL